MENMVDRRDAMEYANIRRELDRLYAMSLRAINPDIIKQYEARISYLESQAAAIIKGFS